MSDIDKYARRLADFIAAVGRGFAVDGERLTAIADAQAALNRIKADLDAANARIQALTLRNEELQRMVDAGLERSSEAAREAVRDATRG